MQIARLRPLAHLGEARAYSVLHDGQMADDSVRDALGRFAHWAHRQTETEPATEEDDLDSVRPEENRPECEETEPATEEGSFDRWWGVLVRKTVFGDSLVREADDIEDLPAVRARLQENWEQLDSREEEYLFRYTAAAS